MVSELAIFLTRFGYICLKDGSIFLDACKDISETVFISRLKDFGFEVFTVDSNFIILFNSDNCISLKSKYK